jgi:hypothetical protein
MSRSLRFVSSTIVRHQQRSSIVCARRQITTVCKSDPDGRPTLDDVQRISEGKAAKRRGTGSRQVPHRLNVEERQTYNIARQKGFLTLKGSGYRRERKGSPLANIYRQLQDALGHPVIVIEQGNPLDVVLIDLSTLRQLDISQVTRLHTLPLADNNLKCVTSAM